MKAITTKEMNRFVFLANSAQYNYELKQEYKKLGRKILKYIAYRLNLTNYDIRWNPGGIACSGDHILHNENFYIALHDNCRSGWFYFRSCKGLKDYTGGYNQIVRWIDWVNGGIDKFIETLEKQFKRIS